MMKWIDRNIHSLVSTSSGMSLSFLLVDDLVKLFIFPILVGAVLWWAGKLFTHLCNKYGWLK